MSAFIIFFFLCRLYMSDKDSLNATLLLSISPVIYTDTLIGFVDTPHIILLTYIGLIYTFSLIIRYNKFYLWIIHLILFYILDTFWNGISLIILLFSSSYFIQYVIKEKYKLLISIILSLSGLIFIVSILNLKLLGVSEYSTTKFIVYHILVILILYKYIRYKAKEWFWYMLLILIIPSFFVQRIVFFSMPLIIILMFIVLDNNNYKKYIILFFYIMFSLVVIGTLFIPMMTDRNYELLMNTIDTKEVVNLWDSGHIINYFIKGNTIYRAFPTEKIKNYKDLLINESYNHNLNSTTNYSIVIKQDDYDKVCYLYSCNLTNHSLYYKLINQKPLDIYTIHSKAMSNDVMVWVLKYVQDK